MADDEAIILDQALYQAYRRVVTEAEFSLCGKPADVCVFLRRALERVAELEERSEWLDRPSGFLDHARKYKGIGDLIATEQEAVAKGKDPQEAILESLWSDE